MPWESLAPEAQQNVGEGSRLCASVLRDGGESGAVGGCPCSGGKQCVCVGGVLIKGLGASVGWSWSISAMPEGWAMHKPSSPTGGLSSGGDGRGQVSCPAWPLGTLPNPIAQAASLPVYYLCCPRRRCLIRARPGPRAEGQTACSLLARDSPLLLHGGSGRK